MGEKTTSILDGYPEKDLIKIDSKESGQEISQESKQESSQENGEVIEQDENSKTESGYGKENNFDTDEEIKQREEVDGLLNKQRMVKEDLDRDMSDIEEVAEFLDGEGREIPVRKHGKVSLQMLDIETDIAKVRRFRENDDEVYALQDSIRRYGLLEPIHVVPYGDYYILVQGYRRLQAHINLGKKRILALVDSTIPAELAKYFQVELNNVLDYTFIEKLEYGNFVEKTQPHLSTTIIEQSLGLKTGDYLKMKYIDQFKGEFPDIFMQVQNGRLSIEQAYKKIDKEIEKQQKQIEKEKEEIEDNLKDVNELDEINVDAGNQERGKRKVLDPVIRRSVESRAGGACECCGYGKGEPDLMGAFQVHHIVPVQYGGSDNKSNLILLCHNCHKLVHDYEAARFTPEQETYDRLNSVKRIVVLGNMLLILKKKALNILRTKHKNIARQVDKGVCSVGAGLEKANVALNAEETEYEGSPYKMFGDATENIEFGGKVEGDLSKIGYIEEDTEEDIEEDTENNVGGTEGDTRPNVEEQEIGNNMGESSNNKVEESQDLKG